MIKENAKKFKEVMVKKSLVSTAPVAHGVGRRKSSVARVWLKHGDGKIVINGRDFVEYCHTDVARRLVIEPFALVGVGKSFNIQVNVNGGGIHSQSGAIRLGISRALVEYNESNRKILRDNGFLTVDSRLKERKKYGQKGARRKFQFVKR
jgi:small subunit ribosomal protein S9